VARRLPQALSNIRSGSAAVSKTPVMAPVASSTVRDCPDSRIGWVQ
jgi:hypothetical protein